MAVLLTRPPEDSATLASRLHALGIETVVSPMLDVDFLDVQPPDLTDVQGLLVTSANGIRAFARQTTRRDLAIWAVGPGSADAARTLGFAHVEHAAGDVAALSGLIGERLSPDEGSLLHVAGTHLAGDLAASLTTLGYDYRRVVMYTAHQHAELNKDARAAIGEGRIDGVVVYSPRTAVSLVQALRSTNLERNCRAMTAFCLSQAVAEKMTEKAVDVDWNRVEVSTSPHEDSLVSLVSRVLHGTSTE